MNSLLKKISEKAIELADFGFTQEQNKNKNIDNFIIESYNIDGIKNIGKQLEKSVLVGGINQEQYFLLIPPKSKNEKWKYWKFANWHPGEEEYINLENYFSEVLNFMNEQIETE